MEVVEAGRVVIEGRKLPSDFWADGKGRRFRKTASVIAVASEYPGTVYTPEGRMDFEKGDYLVTDNPPTHCWPVKREVFESTYQEIES